MNLNKSKKINNKFDSNYYWYIILLSFLIIFILLIIYGLGMFFYVNSQINSISKDAINNAQNSTSTMNSKQSVNVDTLNKVLSEFNNRESVYSDLMKKSFKSALNGTSTSVATSTK